MHACVRTSCGERGGGGVCGEGFDCDITYWACRWLQSQRLGSFFEHLLQLPVSSSQMSISAAELLNLPRSLCSFCLVFLPENLHKFPQLKLLLFVMTI